MTDDTKQILSHPLIQGAVWTATEEERVMDEQIAIGHARLLPVEEKRHFAECTWINDEGYDCGAAAVVLLLPSGDEGRCRGHIQKGAQL
jgi:hypothetical protein